MLQQMAGKSKRKQEADPGDAPAEHLVVREALGLSPYLALRVTSWR